MAHELDELSVTIGELKSSLRQVAERAEEDRTQIKAAIRDLADKIDSARDLTAQTVRDRDREAAERHVENQAQIGKLTVLIGDNAASIEEFKQALSRHEENVRAIQPQLLSLQGTKRKLMSYAAVGLTTLATLAFILEELMKAGVSWVFHRFGG